MNFIRRLPVTAFLCSLAVISLSCSSEGDSNPYPLDSSSAGGDTTLGTAIEAGLGDSANAGFESSRSGTDGSDAAFGVDGSDGTDATVPGQCGDGTIETGEDCENGISITVTCQSLGRGNGTVRCDTNCRYDLSNCTTDTNDPFTVTHEISSAIGTVGIVTWSSSIDGIAEAYIEYGLDINYGMKAPVDLNEPQHRTLLLGMKGSRDYHFRVVANTADTQYKSEDYTLTTGPVINLLQVLELNVDNSSARAGGFIVTSLFQTGTGGGFVSGGGAAGALAFIIDSDGDVVWWYPSTISNVTRARMSYNGKTMWMAPAGRIGVGIERVSMDGLDSRFFNIPATHDITAVTGDVMAYPSGGFTDCVVITEITPDGTTKPVFDTAQLWAGGGCHANAIRYSQAEGLYTLSDLTQGDIIMVDRTTGALVHRLSDFGFNWGGHQHGHHLLSDSIVIFNNGNRIAQEIALDRGSMQGSEIWRYGSEYGSEVLGDVQRLPNGNTMVTYSTAGRIHEVGSDSNRIMEIRFSASIGYSLWRESLYGPPSDITL